MTSVSSTSTNNSKVETTTKNDTSLIEEDDDFEEFPLSPNKTWKEGGSDDGDNRGGTLWEDHWDDDTVEDDFSVQLSRYSLKKRHLIASPLSLLLSSSMHSANNNEALLTTKNVAPTQNLASNSSPSPPTALGQRAPKRLCLRTEEQSNGLDGVVTQKMEVEEVNSPTKSQSTVISASKHASTMVVQNTDKSASATLSISPQQNISPKKEQQSLKSNTNPSVSPKGRKSGATVSDLAKSSPVEESPTASAVLRRSTRSSARLQQHQRR